MCACSAGCTSAPDAPQFYSVAQLEGPTAQRELLPTELLPQIISATGPTFWWAMAMSGNCGASFYSGTEVMRTVSSNFMGRCSLCQVQCGSWCADCHCLYFMLQGDVSKCSKVGMLKHLEGSTWHKAGTKVGNDAHFSHWAFLCQPGRNC